MCEQCMNSNPHSSRAAKEGPSMYPGYSWPKLRGEAEMELRNLDSEKLVQGKSTRQQLLTRMANTHTHSYL